MERNFNNNDFEHFVKQNADQYRMFPSEKVWEGINNTLHTRRRWYGIGLASLLLITGGVVTWVMLSSSGKNQSVAIKQQAAKNIASTASTAQISKEKQFILAPAKSIKNNLPFILVPQELQPGIEASLDNSVNAVASNNTLTSAVIVPLEKDITFQQAVVPVNVHDAKPNTTIYSQEKTTEKSAIIVTPVKSATVYETAAISITNKKELSIDQNLTEKKDIYPLTIESVVNSYKNLAKNKKLSYQIYFTPTVSYRSLKENKEFLNSAQPLNGPNSYSSLPDVNNLVTHKPDIGLELGFSTGYSLTNSLKLIGGIQFNVSKYDIRAYKSNDQVATIALNTGVANASVSTVTSYRNYNGYYSDWLHNLYISASIPIGIELRLAKTKNGSIGISSSIQPTYIISDRAYLLSTDYKNYAEVPSLIRRWNASTNLEAFVTNTNGKIKWKLGPQVRYQLQSSFQDKYPFKEHLFDFGLKFGVILK